MADRPTKTKAKAKLVDDITVRETFADDFVGLFGIGPNFHLTFATRRPADEGAELRRLVAARIVLPLDALLDLYNSLQSAVARLETTGVIKSGPAAPRVKPAE